MTGAERIKRYRQRAINQAGNRLGNQRLAPLFCATPRDDAVTFYQPVG